MEFCFTAPAQVLVPLLPQWQQLMPHISERVYSKETLRIRVVSYYTRYAAHYPSDWEVDEIIEVIWKTGRLFKRVHTPLDTTLLPLLASYANLRLRICNQRVTFDELVKRIGDYFAEQQWPPTDIRALARKIWAVSQPIF